MITYVFLSLLTGTIADSYFFYPTDTEIRKIHTQTYEDSFHFSIPCSGPTNIAVVAGVPYLRINGSIACMYLLLLIPVRGEGMRYLNNATQRFDYDIALYRVENDTNLPPTGKIFWYEPPFIKAASLQLQNVEIVFNVGFHNNTCIALDLVVHFNCSIRIIFLASIPLLFAFPEHRNF